LDQKIGGNVLCECPFFVDISNAKYYNYKITLVWLTDMGLKETAGNWLVRGMDCVGNGNIV